MNTKELQSIKELYNFIHEWREKYTVGWHDMSQHMRIFYRGITHLTKSLQVLTDTESLPPLTIEEKVANAVFYVDQEGRHSISNRHMLNRSFIIFNEHQGKYITIQFDSVPADAYFLATVRL